MSIKQPPIPAFRVPACIEKIDQKGQCAETRQKKR